MRTSSFLIKLFALPSSRALGLGLWRSQFPWIPSYLCCFSIIASCLPYWDTREGAGHWRMLTQIEVQWVHVAGLFLPTSRAVIFRFYSCPYNTNMLAIRMANLTFSYLQETTY